MRGAWLATALLLLAASARAQFPSPISGDLQPPGEGPGPAPVEDGVQARVDALQAQLASAREELARRRAAEAAQAAPPPELVQAVERDYALDPATEDLAPELQARIRIYALKPGRPEGGWGRRLLVVPPDVDAKRVVPVPTVDCEEGAAAGSVRVLDGHYLAAETEKGVFYSDLARPAAPDQPCERFVAVATVRWGPVAAVQALRSLDVLGDALSNAGLAPDQVPAAKAQAAQALAGREQFEIYGNKRRLLATYPSQDGGGLKVFWPEIADQPKPAAKWIGE